MKKFLKRVVLFLILTILLIGLSVCALMMFANPNQLKPMIAAKVSQLTGRKFIIEGDLSWSLFPYLAITVNHASLHNPEGFTQSTFAEIAEAKIGVKLLPLLHKKIETSSIAIHGLTLHLIKNTAGAVNWQFESKLPNQTAKGSSYAALALPGALVSGPLSINIPAIDVTDAHVTWNNQQTKQFIEIKKLGLQAKNVTIANPFPIRSQFDLNSNHPNFTGKVSLSGKLTLLPAQKRYYFSDMMLHLTTPYNTKEITVTLKSNISADLNKQTVLASDIEAQIANLLAHGKLNILDLNTTPKTVGWFTLAKFDLKQWLHAIGQDPSNLQSARDVSGDIQLTTEPNFIIKSNLRLASLQIADIKITRLNVVSNYQNDNFDIPSLTANFYQGTLSSRAKINLKDKLPNIYLKAILANVQAAPLFADLAGKDKKLKIQGVGNLVTELTSRGLSSDELLRHLNGTGHFDVKNGLLEGINIGYLIDSAYALILGKPAPHETDNYTSFGSLTGSMAIHNGNLENNDLLLEAPRITSKGRGTIDLPRQQLNYSLQTFAKHRDPANTKKDVENLYGIALPIFISGTFTNPIIRLDQDTLLRAVAELQVQKLQERARNKIHEKLEEQIKDKIPPEAGQLLQNILGQ